LQDSLNKSFKLKEESYAMVEQIDTGNKAVVRVNANEFRAKYKSKKECFNFLTVQVGAYLPTYETVTI
jgi:hypothetical protein